MSSLRTGRVQWIAIVASAFLGSLSAAGLTSAEADEKEDGWNAVEKLGNEAFKLLDAERTGKPDVRATLRTKRRDAFSKAAAALENWSDKFLDKKGLAYLQARTEAGLWREYAGDLNGAVSRYAECEQHPLFNSPGALWDTWKIPDLIKERKELIRDVQEYHTAKHQYDALTAIRTGIQVDRKTIDAAKKRMDNAKPAMDSFDAGAAGKLKETSRSYVRAIK